MILVDTSAWIDFERGTRSATARRLVDLISSGGPQVAVTEPVVMEVLVGLNGDVARQIAGPGERMAEPGRG